MKIDLRTREGRLAEIIARVRRDGGFSVFWIADNLLRASVGEQMVRSGELVEKPGGKFPWHAMEVKEQRTDKAP